MSINDPNEYNAASGPVNLNKPESAGEPRVEAAGEAPAAGGLGREVTFDEARQIYVQRNYHRFEAAFAKFDEAGKAGMTFSVIPFFIPFLWLFYRKMYLEGVVYFAVSVGVGLFLESSATSVGIVINMMVAAHAKALYWQAVNRKIKQAMELYPQNPEKAVAWLQAKGGVNFWVIGLGVALLALVVAAVYVSDYM
ncbi:hypothetical protein C4J81_11425 [Deltaproteobacteria bacterium Smac51]|nr:hypothetical protein C4J81_11425 [Deltaproteobacteria bacterium Smac51]